MQKLIGKDDISKKKIRRYPIIQFLSILCNMSVYSVMCQMILN